MGYKKFVFKKEKIPKSLIFEVLCERKLYEREVFVKDEFKKIIERKWTNRIFIWENGGLSMTKEELEKKFIALGLLEGASKYYAELEQQDKKLGWLAAYHFVYRLNERLKIEIFWWYLSRYAYGRKNNNIRNNSINGGRGNTRTDCRFCISDCTIIILHCITINYKWLRRIWYRGFFVMQINEKNSWWRIYRSYGDRNAGFDTLLNF